MPGSVHYLKRRRIGGFSPAYKKKRIGDKVRAQQVRYRRLFETSKDGILLVRAATGSIVDVNPALCDLLGYLKHEMLKKNLADICVLEDGETGANMLPQVLAREDSRHDDALLATRSGRRIHVEFVSSSYSVQGETIIQCHIRDITKRLQKEESIRLQAFYDLLTGLPNRFLFNERLGIELANAKRRNGKLAVFFLDLDGFKKVNDDLGHATGDQLLVDVAHRLRTGIRQTDAVARLGGDEFLILLTGISSPEEATVGARKIISALEEPFLINSHKLHVSTSIGISLYPFDGNTVEDLTRSADLAMYRAKESGRSTFRFYSSSMNVNTQKRKFLEDSLRQAIAAGELLLHYQPQVDVATRGMTGVEALVRWHHPALGLLAPASFLPLASESGLLQEIDRWTLRAACEQNKAWQRAGYRPLPISVNLSAKQFHQRDFVSVVQDILATSDLNPQYLCLEITENAAMQNVESLIPKMSQLAGLGVRFAVDNFGTGYTSLNWLNRLPVHELKIDQSFIRAERNEETAKSSALISSIVALAHSMDLRAIDVGVEKEKQVAILSSCGCDGMQGHVFSKPLPEKGIRALMT